MLHRIGDDVDVGVDLTGGADDALHVHDGTGDVGGVHDAQQAGVLVHHAADLLGVDAAGLGIGLSHAELLAGLFAVVLHGVEGGGMLQHGGDGVGTRAVLQNGAHHLEHALGGGHLRQQRAAGGAEHHVHHIIDTPQLDTLELLGAGVYAFRAIGEGLVLGLLLHRRLQAQGAAGVLKEQALAELGVGIHIAEALLDLRRQGGVKQQTMLIVFHRDLLFPFYL